MDLNWFQIGPIPNNAITGTYNLGLVVLSYIIAVLASYVALDLAGRVRAETNPHIQWYWLLGGAFSMGAGIWSMHFIGMLAFIMPMPMQYELSWTISSLIVAILVSGLALFILKTKGRPFIHMVIGGIFIGLGIATMHYMGMMGMTNHINIRYLPSIFALSIVIAIVASEAALWLALQSNQGTFKRQFYLKIISALVMGAAICGMHYTGMFAAIFTPLQSPMLMDHSTALNPYIMAFLIAIITVLIIGLALTVSIYYRQMITAVQNEKEFLNAMLDNLEDGILACNAKGAITVCNNALSHYCKIIKNNSYLELDQFFTLKTPLLETPISLEENPMYLALKGKHIRDKEFLLCYGDTKRNVIIDGQPIINFNGEKLGAVIVIHDITNLKQTERLKKEFVSVVSHELRTPLTSIRGSLSLLVSGTAGELPEKMSYLLHIAHNNTERLIRLINDILDVEKIEAGKMDFTFKELDISEVIRVAMNDVSAMAETAKVKLYVENLEPHMVYGDFDRLIQVVVNLLSNAIRFSSPGQVVSIKVLAFDLTTRISIIDQGSGIPKEFHGQIFQKFSQADSSTTRKKGGSGLGLSICKAIIEKHGGTIHFESSHNQGTCFYFDLPNKIIDNNHHGEVQVNQEKANILICDSNPDSAAIIQKYLNAQHYLADVAYTVHDARELLTKKTYKMIAMDITLQDYDGIKFIQELREQPNTAETPIIIISTRVNESKEISERDGFPLINWIEKPVRPQQLAKLLQYVRAAFPKKLPNILCVEDDPDIIQVIEELLKNEAHILSAPNLEVAKQKTLVEDIDLIILDLRLPDGTGTDLLPCVNIQTKMVIPVIVFSAYELEKKYIHLVKQALLKSQVSTERLFEIIKSTLSGA